MEKRCVACMNMTDTFVCRHCGYNNAGTLEGSGQETFLRPETVIGGRYYVGIPIDRNGEGVSYIAFDEEKQLRVRVREFFPGALCHRDRERKKLTINNGYEIQFKALATDFVELARQLISLQSNNCLVRAKDILSDNGTVYVVYEDVVGISLTKYLKSKGGELSWEETENLFLPLLYTVKMLNANGIVHRGVSPDTILVTKTHELRIKGVCTSAVRAINTEIKPELFSGYAAPEQYEKCTSHGEWTDVYSICAVLYRVLTGSMPPRADMREIEGLIPPKDMSPTVPQAVSDAIVGGLEPSREQRTRSVKDLIGEIYAVSDIPGAAPRRLLHEEEPAVAAKPSLREKFHMPVWMLVIIVTLPLMLALFFVLYFFVLGPGANREEPSTSIISESSSELSSEPSSQIPSEEESSGLPKIITENFVGKYYGDVAGSQFYKNLYTILPKNEKFDESAPIDMIVQQDLEKGKAVEQGSKIRFTVSKGPQFVIVPDIVDESGIPISAEDYTEHFTKAGMTVNVELRNGRGAPEGQLVGVDRTIGERLDRALASEITIYLAEPTPAGVTDTADPLGGEE